MIDRVGQVWRWPDGDICLVVRQVPGKRNTPRHLVMWLLDDVVNCYVGQITYAYEYVDWDEDSLMKRFA